MTRTLTAPPLLDQALERIQELSAAVWEVRAQHEPVRERTWRGLRVVCRTCHVPHPCPTRRVLHTHRVGGC